MEKNSVLFVIAAALVGFIGGFLLANSINRSELNSLRSQPEQRPSANTASSQTPDDTTLSEAEIRSKIDEADKNAGNFAFQKNLGVSLYRYAAMKQDQSIMAESERILTRANSLNANDFEVLVALGNAQFDTAFFKKDSAGFKQARTTYSRALEIKPDDLDVQTDLGLTWFLQVPPDNVKAAAALEKVSAAEPNHTRSMQFLVQTYLKLGRIADAEKTLDKLKQLEPSNVQLGELTSQIANAKGGAK